MRHLAPRGAYGVFRFSNLRHDTSGVCPNPRLVHTAPDVITIWNYVYL